MGELYSIPWIVNSLYLIEWVIRIVMGALIVTRRRAPSAALAWIVLVFFAPFLGSAAYFLIGENRLGSRRVERHRHIVEATDREPVMQVPDPAVVQPSIDPRHAGIAALTEGLGGSPALGRNELELHNDTALTIEAMARDIDAARSHCHLLAYIFNVDDMGRMIVDAVARAAQRGVICRVLVDAAGSKQFLRSTLASELRESGAEVVAALPVSLLRAQFARVDLRNHRKLLVVDGKVAYAGSHNISAPHYPGKRQYGAWHDATVRVTGPIVGRFEELFVQDWYLDSGVMPKELPKVLVNGDWPDPGVAAQALPTGPLSPEPPLPPIMIAALHAARNEAVLTTPYFVPDDALVSALRSAAMRGVRVHLVVPKRSDSRIAQAAGRSYYGELLHAGVNIHEFIPGLLHAKTLTVDNDFALIGSANLDIRSFMLNFEIGLLIYDDDFASHMRFLQQTYMDQSDALTIEAWKSRGRWRRLGDNVAKLMSPLL